MVWSGTGRPPVEVIDGRLACARCKEVKEVSAFYKDRTRYCGYSAYCKDCRRSNIKIDGSDGMPIKNSVLWTKYGIRLEDYERMYSEQDGRCAICNVQHDVLAVDHSHETGVVRGLLCKSCNLGLGKFGDNLDTILRAATYLMQSEQEI